MRVISVSFLVLSLFIAPLISAAQAGTDYVQRATSAAKAVEKAGLCGTYQAMGENAFVASLSFESPWKVVVRVSGIEEEYPFFVDDGKLNVRADKAIFVFEIAGERLIGLDRWNEGAVLKSTSTCMAMRADKKAIEEISHELCHADGVELQSQGMMKAAMEQYLKCCNTGSAVACNQYGLLQGLVGGNSAEARKYFRLACDQSYARGCSNLAEYEEKLGNLPSARRLYEEACSKGFTAACFHAVLVQDYSSRGLENLENREYEAAISDFNNALEQDSKDADTYYYRGLAYFQLGDLEQALPDFSAAIELNPRHTESLFNRGEIYFRMNRYGPALADFQTITELMPSNAAAHYRICRVRLRQREFEQAISACTDALAIEPKFADAYATRSIGHYLIGAYEEAWDDVERSRNSGLEPNSDFLQALRDASGKTGVESSPSATPSGFEEWRDPVTAMVFVKLPGGCFSMGSPDTDAGRSEDEGPAHEVCVDDFWMSKYEVTNRQFRMYKANHDSGLYKTLSLNDESQPAVSVSLDDARNFAGWVGRGNGDKFVFRLPTEAEWEYACRAGTTTTRFWGDEASKACLFANVADKSFSDRWWMYPSQDCNDNHAVSSPVGSFRPNPFGLHDMIGNAFEWCDDAYERDAYARHPRKNPHVTGKGPHVYRGGGWNNEESANRCGHRSPSTHNRGYYYLGFRLVRLE